MMWKEDNTNREELTESLHVQLAKGRQEFFNQIATHAHSREFLVTKVVRIFHACLGENRALEATCLGKDLLSLRVFGVEGWVGGECPAQGREAADHESTKARECSLGGLGPIGSARDNIGSSP